MHEAARLALKVEGRAEPQRQVGLNTTCPVKRLAVQLVQPSCQGGAHGAATRGSNPLARRSRFGAAGGGRQGQQVAVDRWRLTGGGLGLTGASKSNPIRVHSPGTRRSGARPARRTFCAACRQWCVKRRQLRCRLVSGAASTGLIAASDRSRATSSWRRAALGRAPAPMY